MNLGLEDLHALPHLDWSVPSGKRWPAFTGVSTDSRTVAPGNLFLALRGGRFDGHAFLQDVVDRGARAVIVDGAYRRERALPVPVLTVEDTTRALGDLALAYRRKFSLPILAVGGSNGKTTTKEMIVRVLSRRFRVLGTEGNLNNQIGVPQTIFRLRDRHQVAVVEVGTNHPGEIGYLCTILEPTHGLVTNVGREHLEFFRSVAGVAREEGTIYRSLEDQQRSVGFVNLDDPRVVRVAGGVRQRVSYGVESRRAEIRGTVLSVDSAGCAQLLLAVRGKSRRVTVGLRIPGAHNAINAVAAAAVGVEFGVPLAEAGKALASFTPASKRMEVVRVDGITILNDTYNANPDSTIAALQTLAAATVRGKRIAVLADMLELGPDSPRHHARVGREAGRLGIDHLLTFGDRAREIGTASRLKTALHYEQKNMLSEYLAELAGPGDTVLVKGSRGMKMEDVVTFLVERHRTSTA
jgi:UDP-N-acetylmuramoyl-tripeptide--D-alanyl-D-alanine ligase